MFFELRPEVCAVDQPVEVRLTAVLDRSLRPGDSIAFALPESWSSQPYCITYTKEPQYRDPEGSDYVAVSAEGARFELVLEQILLPAGLPKGHVRRIVARLIEGALQPGSRVVLSLHNFRATWLAEAASFRVWIGEEEMLDTPRLRTLAAAGEKLRVIVPSSARPGAPFPVNVVSYDRFWNLSCSTYRGGALGLERGPVLERGVSFTGSYRTTASIAEPGVYWLTYDGVRSNPIRITPQPRGPYWGDLHSHDKVHNCGAGEDPYTYARQVSCLDFVAVSPDFRGLSQEAWQRHVRRAVEAEEPGSFSTIVAYEAGFPGGHHNVYFRDIDGQIFDVSDHSLHSLDRLLPTLDPERVVVVPHHVGVHWSPQKGYYAERDPWISLAEIYSSHGLGEAYVPEHALSYEFNRTRGLESKYATSVNRPVYVRDAWAQGRRYGVVASSDDHMGQPGKPMKGLAALYASANTREHLFAGLKNRQTYGTTGERMLLALRINGQGIGQEVLVEGDDPLRVEVEVHGSDEISFIEVARLVLDEGVWANVSSVRMQDLDSFHEQDKLPALSHVARLEEAFAGDAVYYLRAGQRTQVDDWPVFAWSSPIWVTKKH